MFWADQLLDALNYLHSHTPPIVHGDIKPGNLKLTDENHIILLDQCVGVVPDASSARIDPYHPVEYYKGGALSPAGDVYSFAATFYELMTNAQPPESRKRADAIHSGLPDPLAPPSKLNPDIPPDISDVLIRGLDISPEKRYQTAAEMQRELRRAYKKNREAMTSDAGSFNERQDPGAVIDAMAASDAVARTTDEPYVESPGEEPAPTLVLPDPVTARIEQAAIKTDQLSNQTLGSAITEVGPPTPRAAPPPEPASPGQAMPPEKPSAGQQMPAMTAAAAQPKKSSKTGLLIGVLVVLLLMGGIGGVGAWYAYTHYYAAELPVPSPSPTPVTAPSPVQEVAVDTNTNNNSNTEVSNTNTNADEANANQITARSTPEEPVQTKTTPVTRGKANPPRTTQPVAKPSAKPKSGNDRTLILQ